MKLNKEDKKILIDWGYTNEDIEQIERATTKTTFQYDYYSKEDDRMYARFIGIKETIKLLGREKFLSGISRSAFHWTAYREINDNEAILFNSAKLFC